MMMKKNNNLKSVVWVVVLLSAFINRVQAQSFSKVLNNNNSFTDFCETSNGDMYCKYNRFVYRSTNGGSSWSLITLGTSFPTNVAFGLNTLDNKLIANCYQLSGAPGISNKKGVFISTDNGASWTKKNTGLGNDTCALGLFVTSVWKF